jgi:membrane protease YdiL (CAAX protease family)
MQVPPRPDVPGSAPIAIPPEPTLREQFAAATWGWFDMIAVFFASEGFGLMVTGLAVVWLGLAKSDAQKLIGLETIALGAGVVLWLRYIRPAPLSIFGKPASAWREIGFGLGVGVVALIANGTALRFASLLGKLILGHYPTIDSSLLRPQTVGQKILLGVVLVILAPICEELFFRGFVYGGLRRTLRPMPAALIAATAFALAHVYLLRMPSTFVLGFIFAMTYEHRRNLVPTMVAHAVNNGVVFVVALGAMSKLH